MKQLGIYDNSTIIITADHGFSNPSDDLSLPNAAACLMLVKPAGEDGNKPIETSYAPVCHDDLFGTCLSALKSQNYKDYNDGIFSIKEDENRARIYNHSALISDEDGEIALVEYEVKGDARNRESYKETGNVWDIKYSERAVSKHRYSEFKK